MNRATFIALFLSVPSAAVPIEWKGVFYTPETTYTWLAQKVDGKYADPKMVLVAIPVAGATGESLTQATNVGTTSAALACEEVMSGGTITPAENKCFSLVFDETSAESRFTVDATNALAIAFFAEHLPTEFEATDHYFKDTSGVDIEPVAQEPDGAHSHGHGEPAADKFERNCICQAQTHNWKLDCANLAKIEEAVAALEAKAECKKTGPPQDCKDNFYIMQAHHDHCLHDQLPTGIEKKLHDYEAFYSDCFVKRQFDPDLSVCPAVDCTDATALTNAIAKLQAGCLTTATCAAADCSAAIKTVLHAHDVCSESQLPNNLEVALHDHEEPCEAQLCNTAAVAFNPYDTKCVADVSAASRFGSQEAVLVTASALLFAVPTSS